MAEWRAFDHVYLELTQYKCQLILYYINCFVFPSALLAQFLPGQTLPAGLIPGVHQGIQAHRGGGPLMYSLVRPAAPGPIIRQTLTAQGAPLMVSSGPRMPVGMLRAGPGIPYTPRSYWVARHIDSSHSLTHSPEGCLSHVLLWDRIIT